MSKTKIDWPWKPLHTINPVVGCKRSCPYCYAHKINTHYHFIPKWEEPVYFPERLAQFKKLKETDSCFIDSMSDISYWNLSWKEQTAIAMENSDCENFLLLSKDAFAYEDCQWPDNCTFGLTITGQGNYAESVEYFEKTVIGNTFLSIEPLLGTITIPTITQIHFQSEMFKYAIVGADSNRGAKPPEKEWMQSVKDNVPAEKIYWKNNIRKYLDLCK